MRFSDNRPDPEDIFADTRMSFGDHIEELRQHLWKAIAGLLIGVILSAFVARPVLHFISKPVEDELLALYDRRIDKAMNELKNDEESTNQDKQISIIKLDRRDLLEALGLKDPKPPAQDSRDNEWVTVRMWLNPSQVVTASQKVEQLVNRRTHLAVFNVTEGFMVYFKLCFVVGLLIASPWVFYQLWAFVASGLYPHEKRYVNIYLPFSLFLFVAGVLMCEFWVIPKAVHYLLEFNEWLGLEADLRLNEWLSFAILTPLIFGLSFQTPLVMLFLTKLGIFTSETFRSKRRHAWFTLLIFAIIAAPSADLASVCSLWLATCGLYELGIILARYAERSRERDIDVPEPEEMVEV